MSSVLGKILNKKRIPHLAGIALIAAGLFFLRPFGMNAAQSATIAFILLGVAWWTTGWVHKIITSVIVLAGFLLFSGAPAATVFAFTLTDSFLLLALAYLFSRGISNSGVTDRFIEPLLLRVAKTPLRAVCTLFIILLATAYAIPQPLARLVIVSELFSRFLAKKGVDEKVKNALMHSLFMMYIFANSHHIWGDLILNGTAIAASGAGGVTNGMWISYMAVPSLVYTSITVAAFLLLFRRELPRGCMDLPPAPADSAKERNTKMDYPVLALVVATIAMWMTESLHGISAWIVILAAIAVMVALKQLRVRDLRAIDVTMLVFLSAAMAIGGVMRVSGAAEIIFLRLRFSIPGLGVSGYILVIMLVTICLHMVLGSNMTTVSVVIPGVLIMYGDVLSVEIIIFVVYITTTTQWLLPFHSVSLMIGEGKGYYPASYMLRSGLVMTALVFIAVFGLYVPWWRFMGFL